jgi:catechol 2,3-dioxygenase-like lactoylglutathione lyase family enzyme
VGCLFMVAPGQLLLLITCEKARIPSQTPGGEVPPCATVAQPTSGPGHVAFAVAEEELDDWRARLELHGIEVLSEVAWEERGRSIYFRDPDLHLIEIATPGIWGLDW